MRKLVCLLMLFLISCSCAHTPVSKSVPIKEKINSVVRVFALSSDPLGGKNLTASGFAVNKDQIVTAGHFCEAYQDAVEKKTLLNGILIQYYNQYHSMRVKDGATVQFFEFTPQKDVCILTLKNHGVEPLMLETKAIEVGDKAYAVGAPHGLLPIITEGYVSVPYSDEFSRKIYNNKVVLSVAAYPGMSGCPIFNEDGKVIGMVVMVDEDFHHVTWAVPVELIKEHIDAQ